jgi:hypothetical protein
MDKKYRSPHRIYIVAELPTPDEHTPLDMRYPMTGYPCIFMSTLSAS